MKRIGRPPLPYDVKHVTINMKQAHYVRMRRDGVNMSKLINDFLDSRWNFTICPTCYSDEIDVEHCAKCNGRALFCRALGCSSQATAQMRECFQLNKGSDGSYMPTTCSHTEFRG